MSTNRSALGVWGLTAVIAAAALLVQSELVRPLGEAVSTSRLLVPLAVVTVGFALAEVCVVHLRLGRHAYAFSMSEVPLVIGLFFVRPDLLVLARLAAAVVVFAWTRPRWRKTAFNLALFGLEASVALVVWRALLGGSDPLGPWGWAATGVVALTTSLLGSGLVALAIAVDTGERPSKLSDVFGLGQLVDLVNAVFALVVVYVVSVDWRASWMLVVVILVLVVAHHANERLYGRTERLEQVNRFTGDVGHQLDVDGVVRAVLAGVRDAVAAEVLQIRVTGESAPRVWSLRPSRPDAALADTAADLLDAFPAPADSGVVLVPRTTRDGALREALRRTRVRDYLAVPLQVGGDRIGTLAVADRIGDVDTFTDEDARQLEALANHASVALANAARADQLRRQAAEREYQAMHDDLTGLANRRMFHRRLSEVVSSRPASVLLLDLDRFQEINDTLGHQMGDDLLRLVAHRLTEVAPRGALVARFGGDEFALLLPGEDRLGALAGASVVRAGLARSFDLAGLAVAVDASIGLAVADTAADADGVVRCADVAMYAAKRARSGVEVYHPDLDGYDPTRVGLLADLRDAVATGGFTVAYQPKVALSRGHVVGFEALVRWRHPRHGPVGPDEFIPLAEHSGLITPLTMLVLRAALQECERWRDAGADLSVAVNVSPRSLLDPTFVDEVAHALAAVAVPARALTLEITETSLMADPNRAIEALHQLRRLGVQLSVDDHGTGYSSSAYLQRLPVDEVKIDRSFVQPMPGEDSEAIVGAVIDLGHRLGRRVVAEGVETAAAYERLRALGCDCAQGYWISRPLPADAVDECLAGWPRGDVAGPRRVDGLRSVS